ncbi:MAG: SGNH/GDSL hydrolase family protein [Pseudobacteriovorax sp.]|nr:SGNH/GDSL hydrolase family protein [Pseudobacteriovorax sp.]
MGYKIGIFAALFLSLVACQYQGPKVIDLKTGDKANLLNTVVTRTDAQFDKIYVFGDSMSDPGNLHKNTFGFYIPETVYFENKFSNGPIWIDYVSKSLSVPVVNKAVAGAETGEKAGFKSYLIPGTDKQIRTTLEDLRDQKIDLSRSIAVLWVGPNNYFYEVRDNVNETIMDIKTQSQELVNSGFRTVIVGSMPNLADLPKDPTILKDKSNRAYMTFTKEHAKAFPRMMEQLISENPGKDIKTFRAFQINQKTIDNPVEFGFTDLTSACYEGGYTGEFHKSPQFCDQPFAVKYWDYLHPNTKMHCYYAAQFLSDLKGSDFPLAEALAKCRAGFTSTNVSKKQGSSVF